MQVFIQGKNRGDAHDENEAGENQVGQGQAVPLGVRQVGEPGGVAPDPEVVDHNHGPDGHPGKMSRETRRPVGVACMGGLPITPARPVGVPGTGDFADRVRTVDNIK